ncbi:MAG: anhydro-N-acetylmuramic acid kinase [Methylococcaceae bacterium]|nr:anhydro-N-acetylmuramic acid kinase [Methylococcaceae bacterium]
MPQYFIGLMSGTSQDGIDAALVAFEADGFELVATHYHPYEAAFKERLRAVCYAETVSFPMLGELDAELGLLLGECANRLLEKSGLQRDSIAAIGSHGQTVFHHPQGTLAFSLQIGDPNRIAETTKLTTIADFRRRDLAAGGQGAPLAPAFHRAFFHDPRESRAIVNIGGIANLTLLPKQTEARVFGFDSGPGNTLMDGWIARHRGKAYDPGGGWGKSGKVHQACLEKMLADPYFAKSPPKSTGQEYFSRAWLEGMLEGTVAPPEDIQATLARLTAQTIADAIRLHAPTTDRVLVCGGGAHNGFLLDQLRELLPCPVASTEPLGLHPDWVEATAFAWFARQTLHGQAGNLPEVTGATRAVLLGGIYPAT